jgi:anti-anti-sigma regulatory factor
MQHEGKWQGQLPMRRPNGTYWDMQMNAVALTDANGEGRLVAFVRDVTAQQQAEAERLALQQQLIEAQATALRELSTPLIPITNGVVAMPLVGTIDSSRAQQIMETLLEGIGTHVAETAILDITGVRIVDTQVAQALLQAAQAARLLGAQVVLTGIRPEVAQALVHLGADLHTMVTHSNLQSGIAYALETAQVT